MSKKRIIFIAVGGALALCLLVAGYLLKSNEEKPEQPQPDSSLAVIEAEKEDAPTGPVLDKAPESWPEDSEDDSTFTTRAQLGEVKDSIGVLTIEKIGLSCHVFDSDENTVMEDMKKGAAHYKSTSYWNGNVGLSAHNGNASYSFFDKLPQLKEGDIITYETTLGTRQYAVKTIATIGDEDWSYLDRTPNNCITLTTCITGKETQRLCVQAVEV